MKFPRKLRPLSLAFATVGLLTSLSAIAASPGGSGGVSLPKGAEGLPAYMITAASLDNVAYLNCVKSQIKSPPAQNIVFNNAVALDCRSAKN